MSTLDLSQNGKLCSVYCYNNKIEEINVSNCEKLLQLICYNNQLTNLDLSNCKDIGYLKCYNNQLDGEAMEQLIMGLPIGHDSESENGRWHTTAPGILRVIAPDMPDEQNVVTKAQVAMAKEKNWVVYYLAGEIDEYEAWQEYEGSEPETVDITPMEEGESVVFVNVLDGEASIYDIAVGNIYYCISSDDGSYDPAEGCIIVTKSTDDSAIDGKDIFGEDFKDGYTGIVFKVPSGEGTVKVDAATTGSMTLKVKIGSNEPIARTVEGRQTLSFPYSVSEDTYIYIYGGMNAAGAKGMRKAAGEDALKIYSIEVTSGTDGIDNVQSSKFSAQSPVYTLSGQRIISSPSGRPGGVPTKGIYIQNGRKVLVK